MATDSAALATGAYNQLSKELQDEFGQIIIEKLRGSIGVHGELSVLAEYIQVMLQSGRPPEQIEEELTAFLTNQSGAFTKWLFERILEFVDQADGRKTGRKKVKRKKVRDKEQGEAMAAEKPAAPEERRAEAPRSRSRRRRRRDGEGADGAAAGRTSRHAARPSTDAPPAGSGADKKAVLTPNVQYLREAYHTKADPSSPEEKTNGPPPGREASRWHFRADEPPPPQAAPGPPPPAYAYGTMPPARGMIPGPPPGCFAPPPARPQLAAQPPPASATAPAPAVVEDAPGPKPKHFTPKKWRVVQDDTVVRLSMHLDSNQVCFLRKGEIIEQVAPQYSLTNGIVRLQVRHPSSPSFPNAIGWVTLDASPAGGPRFLEPGPEPMTKGFAPRAPTTSAQWRPTGAARPARPPQSPAFRPVAASPRGVNGAFQNLTWKPGN